MIDTQRQPIDAIVIALNETDHYGIAEEDRPLIATINGVYAFNRNEVTHCCEFTPSYWLIHLYDAVLLTAAGEALDEEAKSELYEKYECCGGESIYVHCHQIDAIIEGTPATVHVYGETGIGYDDTSYDEQMDSLVEHFQGNHVL